MSSEQLSAMASQDQARPIFAWLEIVKPGRGLHASVVSFGVLADTVEALEPVRRQQWRPLLAAARRKLEAQIIDIDMSIIEVWAPLRGMGLKHDDGEDVGADELMVIATAIARGYSLIASHEDFLDTLVAETTLTVVHP
ncbi:MAG: hypothetical protein KKA45_13205 [Alphaproteobacteria bacterium]|nr:hypothetical protein [Alphaproteobacteria bacterium]